MLSQDRDKSRVYLEREMEREKEHTEPNETEIYINVCLLHDDDLLEYY